ncbi:MAG TPA: glutamate 5-kinase, partial [Spirochaetia bacterium]|nr:glutamate 5-kinase [Spirochaetia bacterium]
MNYRRIVVKVGTNSVCGKDGYPSLEKISLLGGQVKELINHKVEVVLVSSGAV